MQDGAVERGEVHLQKHSYNQKEKNINWINRQKSTTKRIDIDHGMRSQQIIEINDKHHIDSIGRTHQFLNVDPVLSAQEITHLTSIEDLVISRHLTWISVGSCHIVVEQTCRPSMKPLEPSNKSEMIVVIIDKIKQHKICKPI